MPVDRRVRVDGEYGGLGLVLNGNRWPGRPQAYEMTDSQARLTERYVEVSRDWKRWCGTAVCQARSTPRRPMSKTRSTDT